MLPGLAMPFGVFLMTQYFRAIPREIDEAALLDNASRFKVFWRVLLPLTLPAQATLGIFTFLHAWNDYWWPLISGTNERMYTLTVGIALAQINFAESDGLGFLMAQAMFAALPILDRLPLLPEVHRPRSVGDGGMRTAAIVLAAPGSLHALAGCGPAQAPDEIRVQRFFGACRAAVRHVDRRRERRPASAGS